MTELGEVKVIAWIVIIALVMGALVCIREGVVLYRECPTDGIYKLPLTVAVVLTLIGVLAVYLT